MTHLRRLWPYLRRHRGSLVQGGVALVLTSILSAASPWVLRSAIDTLKSGQASLRTLWLFAGLLLGLVALEGVCRYVTRRVLIGLSREIEYELRNDLFAHLLRLSPGYYQSQRVGDIMSRAVSDLSAVRMVLGPGIMYMATTIATFVVTVTLMATISFPLLALTLVPLVCVTYLMRRFGRRVHDRFEEVQAQLATLSAFVQEHLAGVRVLRAYVQEAHESRRFAVENQAYLDRNRRLIRIYGSLYPGIQLLMGLSSVLVVFLGGRLAVSGQMSLGDFVAFLAYLAMLNWPMIAVGWVLNLIERGEASMGRLLALLDAPVEIQDGAETTEGAPLQGGIRVEKLTFRYPGAARPALEDVSFDAPAGSTVAIVGPTGSGKSTLVQLLPRLFDPPPGTVFVDGHDVRSLALHTLRSAIGMVPQESFLFSQSLRANIAFGLPSDDDPRVENASHVAQLDKDVQDFPARYDTLVGERGLTLSGGQKQRTALARALARDPRILILDDALAALDTETEEQVLNGLRAGRRTRTTLIVSHRVSSVKDADQILVLRDGRIAERGTHAQLVLAGGFYADLHRRQLLEAELEKVS